MLRLKKSPTILRISIKLSAILVTDYDQFESPVGQREKTKFLKSIMNFPNGRSGLWRRCCLTRFGCLEEEINKEAQTFIKAVGDFLANAVEVGSLPSWFYKIYVNQKFIKFFENFDTMYD